MPKPASPAPAAPATLGNGVAAVGRVKKNVTEYNKISVDVNIADIVALVRKNVGIPDGVSLKNVTFTNNNTINLHFEGATDRDVEDMLK